MGAERRRLVETFERLGGPPQVRHEHAQLAVGRHTSGIKGDGGTITLHGAVRIAPQLPGPGQDATGFGGVTLRNHVVTHPEMAC